MLSDMRNLLSHPILIAFSFLATLLQLFFLPLDISRWTEAGNVWGQWVRSVWEAPMLRDVLLVGMGASGTLFLICTSLWIENHWEELRKLWRNCRASLYLRRSSVRRGIRNLRTVIQRKDYSAIFRGMQHLYPKLQSHGIPMMKTHYRHTDGSLGWDVPLEDSKWRVLHDDLLSNLERMPGCWRLIWNFVIGKVCDFDFDVDRWRNYVEMREEEFEKYWVPKVKTHLGLQSGQRGSGNGLSEGKTTDRSLGNGQEETEQETQSETGPSHH